MANVKISELTAVASASGTQEFEVNDSGTSKKATGAQIATYVSSVVTSSPTLTGQVSLDDGSVSAPSLTNTGDTNTGIYFPAADTIGLTAGGTESLKVTPSGTTFNNAIIETPYNLTGTAIDPSNGTVQYKTLSANTTFTSSIATGEAVTLMINDGTAYTVTWPTMTWVNNAGVAPTLATTGYTVVALWNVGGTLYGALVGDGT